MTEKTGFARARLLGEEIRWARDKQKPSILSRIYPAMDHGKNHPPKDATPCTTPEVDHAADEQPEKKASKDKPQEQLSPFARRLLKTLVDDTTSWFPPTSAITPDDDDEEAAAEARLKDGEESDQSKTEAKNKLGKAKYLKGFQSVKSGHG